MTDRLNETIDLSRRGRFRLGRERLIGMTRRESTRLFAMMVPVRVEMLFDVDCVEYICISRLFEACDKRCECPYYIMEWDGIRWTARNGDKVPSQVFYVEVDTLTAFSEQQVPK